ncbi:MAG: leucine-rich repeat protein [Clostridium sp.]|nr:leucine-rich repeat protein [Clostridium sp.]MCM1399021.1 leucine-rich repeat protein [Clostridium sp.]MCM1458880.1 leucine-rich repeat protein [Bacteroides sp.]
MGKIKKAFYKKLVALLIVFGMVITPVPIHAEETGNTPEISGEQNAETNGTEEQGTPGNATKEQVAELESLLISTTLYPNSNTVIMQNEEDTYKIETVFSADVKEYNLGSVSDTVSALYFRAKPKDENDTVTIKYGETSADIKWLSGASKNAACISIGKNTFTIEVAGEGKETTTYTFQVDCMPMLTGLTVDTGDYIQFMDRVFTTTQNEYTITLPSDADSVTVNAVPRKETYKITYNGSGDSTVDISSADKILVKVLAGEGEHALENLYTINLNKLPFVNLTFNVTPADATICVYDKNDERLEKVDGSYQGLFATGDYTYTVTKAGYVGVGGIVPGEGGTVNVKLKKATQPEEVSTQWYNFRNSDVNMGITSTKTPISLENSELKWAKSLGSGWNAAPSVQIIVDDSLIVMSANKTVYKLDLSTGEILAQADMVAAPDWGYTPPSYGAGMIFCPLTGGIIQAFDAKTLESLWVYKDTLGGQSLAPIAYSDGYIYTGFWNGEVSDANYVCISVTDEDVTNETEEKLATWKYKQTGGFYWAGAVVIGDYVIVGTDDGERGTEGNSTLYSFDKITGDVKSSIPLNGLGDQRSSIAYDKASGKVYFTTKGGHLCSAKVDAEGNLSGLKTVDYNAQSTSTPIVYKNRVYFAVGSGITTTGSMGNVVVADADTLEMLYAVGLQGYPQCSLLLSTAYEEKNGYIYLYSTYNNNPGGISMIKVKADAAGADEAELVELYDAEGYKQYCIASIICDKEGTLYYKNDSGNVFAVGKKVEEPTVTEQPTTEKVTTEAPKPEKPAVGDVFKDSKSKGQYKVTSSKTVTYTKTTATSGEVTVPATVKYKGTSFMVTQIGSKAFKSKTKITGVSLGKNIKTVGSEAFSGCSKLKTVKLNSNLTKIGNKAFYNCKALTAIKLGSNVTSIGTAAFAGCTKLSSVSLSSKLTTIGDSAFKKCTALTGITIPKNVTKIGKQAFYGCKKLKKITVATTKLKSAGVGANAFKGIYAKATVTVPKNKKAAYKKLISSKGAGKNVNYK